MALWREAATRGYRFDASKIAASPARGKMVVSDGQLGYEFAHRLAKLKVRDPVLYRRMQQEALRAHPAFRLVAGLVAEWEIVSSR